VCVCVCVCWGSSVTGTRSSLSLSYKRHISLSFPPFSQCEMKDVENEEKRNSLFLELLESSNKWEEFQHLILLLQAWPPMTDKSR